MPEEAGWRRYAGKHKAVTASAGARWRWRWTRTWEGAAPAASAGRCPQRKRAQDPLGLIVAPVGAVARYCTTEGCWEGVGVGYDEDSATVELLLGLRGSAPSIQPPSPPRPSSASTAAIASQAH
uniref:Uncharacterized protein n=1 Tax=Leersia perrieri TaxID=77586 RepID=A0A0D9XF12_9ORYZ